MKMINFVTGQFRVSILAILLMLLSSGLTIEAQAGRMKDIQLLHIEAIATHLYGHPDIDGLETRKTAFEKPEPGFFTAVSSEVLVYSAVRQDFEWVKCTTMIDRMEVPTAAGAPKYDYSVAKTVCN